MWLQILEPKSTLFFNQSDMARTRLSNSRRHLTGFVPSFWTIDSEGLNCAYNLSLVFSSTLLVWIRVEPEMLLAFLRKSVSGNSWSSFQAYFFDTGNVLSFGIGS